MDPFFKKVKRLNAFADDQKTSLKFSLESKSNKQMPSSVNMENIVHRLKSTKPIELFVCSNESDDNEKYLIWYSYACLGEGRAREIFHLFVRL